MRQPLYFTTLSFRSDRESLTPILDRLGVGLALQGIALPNFLTVSEGHETPGRFAALTEESVEIPGLGFCPNGLELKCETSGQTDTYVGLMFETDSYGSASTSAWELSEVFTKITFNVRIVIADAQMEESRSYRAGAEVACAKAEYPNLCLEAAMKRSGTERVSAAERQRSVPSVDEAEKQGSESDRPSAEQL